MEFVIGAETGGSENQEHKGRDYTKRTEEPRSVTAGAAQGLHTIVYDSCP